MNKIDNKTKYISLAPRDERKEEYQEYYNALDFALTEESIRNIAITGSYGSGKSSIINSYFKNSSFKDEKIIKVSLANFKQSLSETEIEDEVLKCLFYSIDGRKLKSSQYQKIMGKVTITDLVSPLLFAIASIMIIGLINVVTIILNSLVNDINSLKQTYSMIIARAPFMVMVVLPIVFIVLLFVLVRGIVVNYNRISPFLKSIMLKNLKMDISENIFDKNMHEIVSMMIDIEENIFVFEDLDRFNESIMIFEKLRNLNVLINNNEIIKKRMSNNKCIKCKKFIYELKDDLNIKRDKDSTSMIVVNEQRTKFFDFIIPIIPMITQNNIAEEFNNIIKKSCIEQIDREFINKTCIYINSRRDINNIINEFNIYKGSLKTSNEIFDNKELMALIVYKNINPKEFAMLQEKDSLNGVFKEINRTRIELLNEYTKEKNNIEKKQYPYLTDIDIKRKEDLEVRICALRGNDKGIYREDKILSILNDKVLDNKPLDEFVIMAIKNKYIDNNYYNYINYFYEGQLTINDRQYIKIVNLKGEHDKEYHIDNASNVYEYLDENDFLDKSILNYSLAKYALINESGNIKTSNLIQTIVREYGLKEINEVVKYINTDMHNEDANKVIREFLNMCFKEDNEVFESIDDEKVMSKGEQFDIANRIILSMSPEQINIIDKNKKLTKIASSNIKLISEMDEEKQNVYLNNIDFDCSIAKCDYDDKVGILSKKIVKKKIDNKEPVGYYNLLENYFKHEKKENFNNNEFVNNNYDYICDSGDNDLISNIENNIDSYTENCLLKTGAAKIEFTDKILVLLYLLKNEKNVEAIISKMDGEYDIAQFNCEIDDKEQQYCIKRKMLIYNSVIKNYNVNLKLESLYKYYELCGWNDSIVEYVSKKFRYLQDNKNLEILEEASDFCAVLLMKCKDIDGIEMLISNQRISLQAGQFNALSDKIKSYLINHNNLDYSTSLIQPIKLISNKYLLIYLTNNIDEYLRRPLDYDSSVTDIEDMIKLDKMNDEQIFKLIDLRVTGDKVIEHNGKIEKFIISSKKAFNQIIMEKAMNNLSFNNKVAMLLNKIDTIDNTLLMHLLRYNGGLFKEYLINGTQNLYSINTSMVANGKIKKLIEKLKNISIIKVQKLENDDIIFQL